LSKFLLFIIAGKLVDPSWDANDFMAAWVAIQIIVWMFQAAWAFNKKYPASEETPAPSPETREKENNP
jgi:hypothetical protein